ncbi:MAG: type II toxin-antitoxin system RelE/ParE family toxin [Rhodanobacteraceae bacterium]
MTPRKPRLVYTAAAIEDLVRLRAFIAEHDSAAANRIGTELITRIEALRDFPQMGNAVEAAPDPEAVRDMVFGNYIVRYVVSPRTIAVLRLWHHFENRGRSKR